MMEITRRESVPTGDIFVVTGERGPLEVISLGDYGKHVNLNRGAHVADSTPMIPLQEKWVITISTQYGCSMGCTFCDVPKVGPGRNASLADMCGQVQVGLSAHPDVTWSNRLNIHYARMGEPTWNAAVLEHAVWMKRIYEGDYNVHPVISTMLPRRNKGLRSFLRDWMELKNDLYQGNAGLQFSLNSTDEAQRERMFSGNATTLEEAGKLLEGVAPKGRKITLNFPVCEWPIDPAVLLRHFDPAHYIVKLTPMHKTNAATAHGHETPGDYTTNEPYEGVEQALKDAGYDTLVFITSKDEDVGMITCGNVILAGKQPLIRTGPMKFDGRNIARQTWVESYRDSLIP